MDFIFESFLKLLRKNFSKNKYQRFTIILIEIVVSIFLVFGVYVVIVGQLN
tara:strand:- start:2118 stop:2270 length:153 start_codon:yes stop_codon:yes gene_type:complete